MDRAIRFQGGFSLVELMIVIAIVGILAAVIGLSGVNMTRRDNVSGDTHRIAAFLKKQRLKAFTQKRCFTFIGGTGVTSFMSTDNTCTAYPGQPDDSFAFNQGVTFNGIGAIVINTRGVFTTAGTISPVWPNGVKVADKDCVVVSATRVRIGSWDGVNCNMF